MQCLISIHAMHDSVFAAAYQFGFVCVIFICSSKTIPLHPVCAMVCHSRTAVDEIVLPLVASSGCDVPLNQMIFFIHCRQQCVFSMVYDNAVDT